MGAAYSPVPAPDVAFSAGNFLAVWTSFDFPAKRCFVNLYGARVTAAGAVLDRPPLAIATPHQHLAEPAIAPEDDGYIVAWTRRSKSQHSVQALHVAPDGTSGDIFELSDTPSGVLPSAPDVACDGESVVAVWEQSATIVSTSVDLSRQGIRVVAPISGRATDPHRPAIAAAGNGYLAAWHDSPRGKDPDVFAAALGPLGEPRSLPNGDVSLGANEQIHAAVARGELVYLAAWQDYRRRNGAELFGGRISTDGAALDGTGFSLQLGDVRRPAIAYGMGVFLIVAERHGPGGIEVVATRVTEEGTVLDPGGIPIAIEGVNRAPSVAFNGIDFAVAWVHRERYGKVMFARVSPAGIVKQPGGMEVAAGRGPQIAFNGKDHLLVYTARRRHIEALVFNVDEPPDVAHPIRISIGDDVEHNPAVAAAPSGRFLVVWEQCGEDCAQHDLYAARVTGAGTVLDEDGFPVAATFAHETNAALTFNGELFVLAYQRCLPLELCVPQPPLERPRLIDPLFGARITPEGRVLDPGGVLVTDADKWNRPAALARAGDGSVILLYQRTEPLPPYGDTARIFLRVLGGSDAR